MKRFHFSIIILIFCLLLVILLGCAISPVRVQPLTPVPVELPVAEAPVPIMEPPAPVPNP